MWNVRSINEHSREIKIIKTSKYGLLYLNFIVIRFLRTLQVKIGSLFLYGGYHTPKTASRLNLAKTKGYMEKNFESKMFLIQF